MVGSSFCKPERRARQADLGQAGAHAVLAGDERRPAGGAALLGVVVGEHHAFLGHPVDVGRLVAHHPMRVGADVRLADVVAPDDADVRLAVAARPGRRRFTVFPVWISNNPVSRMLRYFLDSRFSEPIVYLRFEKTFLEKMGNDYDKNPKNLIHQLTHVVHKFGHRPAPAAGLDDWTFDREIGDFVALLQENGIKVVADVRMFPGSRRYPQFGAEALAHSLGESNIHYQHFPELGGRRKARPD